MRSRAERRHKNWSKALRKQSISIHNYGFEWYKTLHKYSKNKIHCSCKLCRCKTNNNTGKHVWAPAEYWSMMDFRRIEEMKAQEKEYNTQE